MMKITDFKLTNDLVNKLNEYAHQIFFKRCCWTKTSLLHQLNATLDKVIQCLACEHVVLQ